MRRIVRLVAVLVVVLLVAAVWTTIAWPASWRTSWSFVVDHWAWWALAALAAVAVLLLWMLGTFLRRPWGTPWRAHIIATADDIEHQLDVLPVGGKVAERKLRDSVDHAVRRHLHAARRAAWPVEYHRTPISQQFIDAVTGAAVEVAFVNVHKAEIALAQLLPDNEIKARIPEALARLQTTMDVTDPRRQAAERELDRVMLRARRRAAFQNAVRIGFEAEDRQQRRIRTFRNIVVSATLGLTVLVAVVCLVGALNPDALPLCFGPPPTTAPGATPAPVQGPAGVACPSEEAPPTPGTRPRRLPAPGDVSLVAFLGLLGGGLSAAAALRQLQGISTPYSIPVALSLLKLPSGALTAVVGLLLVSSGFIPGLSQLDSQPQILAYAFLFGISQQLVTRLIDRQARDILVNMPSTEPTVAKPEPPPTDQKPQTVSQPRRLLSWRRGRYR